MRRTIACSRSAYSVNRSRPSCSVASPPTSGMTRRPPTVMLASSDLANSAAMASTPAGDSRAASISAGVMGRSRVALARPRYCCARSTGGGDCAKTDGATLSAAAAAATHLVVVAHRARDLPPVAVLAPDVHELEDAAVILPVLDVA